LCDRPFFWPTGAMDKPTTPVVMEKVWVTTE